MRSCGDVDVIPLLKENKKKEERITIVMEVSLIILESGSNTF
jgi:hypothetical protein